MSAASDNDGSLITNQQAIKPDTRKDSKHKFPPTTAPLRRLSITAKSTKLAKLDLLMRGLGYNTLVKDMERYRTKGHSVDWLVEMTARDGDVDPSTPSRINKLCSPAGGEPHFTLHHSPVKRLGP